MACIKAVEPNNARRLFSPREKKQADRAKIKRLPPSHFVDLQLFHTKKGGKAASQRNTRADELSLSLSLSERERQEQVSPAAFLGGNATVPSCCFHLEREPRKSDIDRRPLQHAVHVLYTLGVRTTHTQRETCRVSVPTEVARHAPPTATTRRVGGKPLALHTLGVRKHERPHHTAGDMKEGRILSTQGP